MGKVLARTFLSNTKHSFCLPIIRKCDFRWNGDGGEDEDGFVKINEIDEGGNATFLEGAVATFLDSVPLQVLFSINIDSFSRGFAYFFINSLLRPR